MLENVVGISNNFNSAVVNDAFSKLSGYVVVKLKAFRVKSGRNPMLSTRVSVQKPQPTQKQTSRQQKSRPTDRPTARNSSRHRPADNRQADLQTHKHTRHTRTIRPFC